MQTMTTTFRRYRWWLAGLLALAAAAAGGAFYYQKSSTPVAAVTTAVVERGDIRSVVAATGTLKALNSVDISSRVTGLISEVKVKENDLVKAGQVLAILDDTSVRAQVEQYRAQAANYAAVYERSRKLYAIGGESAQQLDSDRTNHLVAKANYENFVTQLGYYVITSPIDGMVVGTPTPAGQTVVQGISAAQVLMTIADLAKMEIKVLVDETDIGKIKAGQQVSFTVDAYADKTFTGKVTSISRSATTSSNVIYYPVYVAVNTPQDLLFPTMTARVAINVGESKNVLVVPLSAVKEEKGEKYVQVMAGGQELSKTVQAGLSGDENIEIVSGLSEGEQVVLPTEKPRTTSSKNQGPPPPF
ncbi:efflux RND transporter periplasmic adaptor subunit [Anaeroselena agilis]|uniref:Efflux RND transporter periplasmic adaptor subunit n=1 Tax=Anaeroselena agilis TaxID=3063788 RepID=A0ABU3P359_9FIRM|nr:efflux RND transporter periplasmic adaptor subunit [Selenomonadales bacterium 4137-cl]